MLDGPALLDAWTQACAHEYGRRDATARLPWVSLAQVRERLHWSFCVQERDRQGVSAPTAALPDIASLLQLAQRPGAVLSGKELLQILRIVEEQGRYADYLQAVTDDLQHWAASVAPDAALLQMLARSLDADGVLQDSASPELARLRQDLRRARDTLQQQLNATLRQWRHPVRGTAGCRGRQQPPLGGGAGGVGGAGADSSGADAARRSGGRSHPRGARVHGSDRGHAGGSGAGGGLGR